MARSPFRNRLLLIGGAVVAAGAVALLKRDKVAGLLPSRSGEPEPYTPPQQSNYDAPGPVANTATPVPAPDSHEQPRAAIDEAAEEAAAAAEARAIGGTTSAYAGPEGEPADAAERPLAEAGEGESEGDEQTDADLETNAEFRDDAPSDAERQIEDTIEEASQPSSGETPETVQESFLPPAAPTSAADETAGDEADAAAEAETADTTEAAEAETADTAAVDETAPATDEPAGGTDQDDSDDWRTWSGRSVKP
jgi:hypothetical protein